MRWPAWLVVVLGCDSAIGIEIRVPPELDGVDRVELYLAVDETCDQCPGIAPERQLPYAAGRGPIEGEVYRVDGNEVFESKVVDGSAWFRIQGAGTLPAAIAIGTGPDQQLGTIILGDLELGRGRHYIADLLPAGRQLTIDREPSETNVEVWTDPEKTYRCVGAEITGRVSRRVFIVPEDDPDCDAVPMECKPFVHLAQEVNAVDVADVTCGEQRPVAGTPQCTLGRERCDELTPDLQGCTNQEVICVTRGLCDVCPVQIDDACIRGVFDPGSSQATHIECEFELLDAAAVQDLAPCTNEAAVGPAVGRDNGGMLSCPPTAEIGPLGYPFGPFGVSHVVTFPLGGALTITVQNATDPLCHMGIRWEGSVKRPPDMLDPVPQIALVRLEADDTHSILVPIVFKPRIVTACSPNNRCNTLQELTDPVFQCLP